MPPAMPNDMLRRNVSRSRVTRGLRAIGGFIIVLLAANCLFWLRLNQGVVVAATKNPQTGETIVVRDLPSSNPFWAASLGSAFRYHVYRCEYYSYGMSDFSSSQTYTDRGYRRDGAKIEWHPDNSATVSFSSVPDLSCNKGWWSKPH
jgi:hypothetical protein